MRPSLGGARPAIKRSSVLLPQPDGPNNERKAPGATRRSIPASATVPLRKVLPMPATSTMGAATDASFMAGKCRGGEGLAGADRHLDERAAWPGLAIFRGA